MVTPGNPHLEQQEREGRGDPRHVVEHARFHGERQPDVMAVSGRFEHQVEQEDVQDAQWHVHQRDEQEVDAHGDHAVHESRSRVRAGELLRFLRHEFRVEQGARIPEHRTERVREHVVDVELAVRARVDAPDSSELRGLNEYGAAECEGGGDPESPAGPTAQHEAEWHEQHDVHHELQHAVQAGLRILNEPQNVELRGEVVRGAEERGVVGHRCGGRRTPQSAG